MQYSRIAFLKFRVGAAAETSASWVQNNIAPLVESVQNLVGDVSFFTSVAAIGG